MGKMFIFTVSEPIKSFRMTPISTVRGFLTVTDRNDFNGLAQTTNLVLSNVRSCPIVDAKRSC
jgi:hypothetical protein